MSEVCDECSGQCPSCGFDIDALRAENERLRQGLDFSAGRATIEAFMHEHARADAAEARVAEMEKARRE